MYQVSGPRGQDQGPAGRARAPQEESVPQGKSGPAGRFKARVTNQGQQDRSESRRTNQASQENQDSGVPSIRAFRACPVPLALRRPGRPSSRQSVRHDSI